jgi:hypothetical protein
VRTLVSKIRAGASHGETDGMALSGILSAQMFHRLFITDFSPQMSGGVFTVMEDHRTP